MKKVFAFLTLAAFLSFSFAAVAQTTKAKDAKAAKQEVKKEEVKTDSAAKDTAAMKAAQPAPAAPAPEAPKSFHQVLKTKFIEGGAGWMAPILLVLIFGLGLAIERIIYLNLSTTNTKKLLIKVEDALSSGGIEAAKEVCKNTRGPVASIFWQGLDRHHEGMEMVEKAISSYGGVLMGRLESNLSWISLFIALSPMLGFLGTVIGMVGAFDAIAAAGDISPTIVASGIKVALLTTVFGLIVAMILQVFYNYLVSKIESIVNTMEDATISFMDILVKYDRK